MVITHDLKGGSRQSCSIKKMGASFCLHTCPMSLFTFWWRFLCLELSKSLFTLAKSISACFMKSQNLMSTSLALLGRVSPYSGHIGIQEATVLGFLHVDFCTLIVLLKRRAHRPNITQKNGTISERFLGISFSSLKCTGFQDVLSLSCQHNVTFTRK